MLNIKGLYKSKYPATHNYQQQSTTTHNHLQPFTTTQKTIHKQFCYCTLDVNTETNVDFDRNTKQVILKYATLHNHPQLLATTHNHPQLPTTIHNPPQPPITINNYPQPSTTIYSHP